MYFDHNSAPCLKCGGYVHNFKGCEHCKDAEALKDVKCPCCKSLEVRFTRTYGSNNIFGPGNASWVTSEHIVCTKCGVLFVDVNKIKEK
jgi:hypothetical protein